MILQSVTLSHLHSRRMGAFCSICRETNFSSSTAPSYEPLIVVNGGDNGKTKGQSLNHSEAHAVVNATNVASNIPAITVPTLQAQPTAITVAHQKNNNIVSKTGFSVKYDLKDVIGVGSTSTCHRCVRKSDGMEFACKVIDKKTIEIKYTGLMEQFNIEIKVLKLLNHPNIIHLADTYETSEKIYMIMEVMKGGELFDYVVEKGTLSEEEASLLVRKITSAVAHMHSLNIIHRDLKPENLLLTSKGPNAEVKLIDFGLAKVMSDSVQDQARSFLGTRGYLAPEMLQRHTYDKAIDIWALGVIVFVLLCGCLPFDDDSAKIETESDAKLKFTLRFPRWASNLSEAAKDLLLKLLAVDPKDRITADQALRHSWVAGKAVTPNNYLQSPKVLGNRKLEQLRSPITPRIQNARNKIGIPAIAAPTAPRVSGNTRANGAVGHHRVNAYEFSAEQIQRKNSI